MAPCDAAWRLHFVPISDARPVRMRCRGASTGSRGCMGAQGYWTPAWVGDLACLPACLPPVLLALPTLQVGDWKSGRISQQMAESFLDKHTLIFDREVRAAQGGGGGRGSAQPCPCTAAALHQAAYLCAAHERAFQ